MGVAMAILSPGLIKPFTRRLWKMYVIAAVPPSVANTENSPPGGSRPNISWARYAFTISSVWRRILGAVGLSMMSRVSVEPLHDTVMLRQATEAAVQVGI